MPTLILITLLATPELSGRIVAIADGDTATLLTTGKQQHKIRLACSPAYASPALLLPLAQDWLPTCWTVL